MTGWEGQKLPNETDAQALVRRVKMHEFLMTGGVSLGYDKDGTLQYSAPIVVADTPVCPWHEEDCVAWEELKAGRSFWGALEAERDDPETTPERKKEIERKLEERPDLREIRHRTPEQIAAKVAARKKIDDATKPSTKPGVYAEAGPKTLGNPWDNTKHPTVSRNPKPSAKLDASALAGEEVPDEIVIDGDEEDE